MAIAETEVVTQSELLDVHQMARFVMDGFIEFDDLVPDELSEAVYADEMASVDESGPIPEVRWHITDNAHGFYERSPAVRAVHNLPRVKGILQSLLGPGHVASHSALHCTGPRKDTAQMWHVDAGGRRQVRLPRVHPWSFDILTAYFAHDTPHEMGPTLVLPGSHMRTVLGPDAARYKNIAGQKRLSGKAGRIAFMHEALWHCAQTNETDQWRFMFKIRYNPRVPQRGHLQHRRLGQRGSPALLPHEQGHPQSHGRILRRGPGTRRLVALPLRRRRARGPQRHRGPRGLRLGGGSPLSADLHHDGVVAGGAVGVG